MKFDCLYILNNTITAIAGATYRGIGITAHGTITNMNIQNNIIYGFDNHGINISERVAGVLTIDTLNVTYNNLYSNGTNTVVVGGTVDVTDDDITTGNITTDPTFESTSDYHLQAGSGCINAGIATGLAFITTDNDDVAVGNPPEIGAYEYQE